MTNCHQLPPPSASHNSLSCVLKCDLSLSSLSHVGGHNHQAVPARGLKSLGDTSIPATKGLGRGTPEWLWKRKCPVTACSQPGSHPELSPYQCKRRSGNQRHQLSLPTSGCVIPQRQKCQKWGKNQQGHDCTLLLHFRCERVEGAADSL